MRRTRQVVWLFFAVGITFVLLVWIYCVIASGVLA